MVFPRRSLDLSGNSLTGSIPACWGVQANFSNFVLPNQTLPANYSIYHGWTSPITGCSTASFNAVYFVNGGSFPFNTTDSAPCKAWKAAATLCTTQPTA